MRKDGLRIEGGRGETLIKPAQATDDPATVGPVDFVLFCVKLWDVETAGEAIKPMVGPTTAVIPLQNGIDAAERLIPILGAHAVMGGVAQISATIAAPGVIRQVGTFMRLVFGELDGGKSNRGATFLNLCQKAGFDATLSEQIMTDLWMKFILLASNAAMTAASRTGIGLLRDDPDAGPLFARAYAEVAAVGRAKGIKLPPDAVERTIGFNGNAPPTMMASMAHDLIRGNRIELPWLSGKVVALGREFGVPTPVHEILYAVLKPSIDGRQA
jgi:2-dehydropantoate 2-reductase